MAPKTQAKGKATAKTGQATSKKKSKAAEAVEVEMEDNPPLAPLPDGATPIRIGRGTFPDLYAIQDHSKVPEDHGRIIMVIYDWRKKEMKKMFDRASEMSPPPTRAKASDAGETFCLGSDGLT
jgi:hypothetical protein